MPAVVHTQKTGDLTNFLEEKAVTAVEVRCSNRYEWYGTVIANTKEGREIKESLLKLKRFEYSA